MKLLLTASRPLCQQSLIRPACPRSILLPLWRSYSTQKNPSGADIANLVPLKGLVDLVDTHGKFHKSQPIITILNSLRASKNRLIAVNIEERGDGKDPLVVCRLLADKSKQKKPASQATSAESEPIDKSKRKKKEKSNEPHKAKDRSKNASKPKTLALNWTIGPKDLLNQKKSSIQSWLEKGHPVLIFLGNPRERHFKPLTDLDLEKRELLRKTCVSICEEIGAVKRNSDNVVKADSQEVLSFYLPAARVAEEE